MIDIHDQYICLYWAGEYTDMYQSFAGSNTVDLQYYCRSNYSYSNLRSEYTKKKMNAISLETCWKYYEMHSDRNGSLSLIMIDSAKNTHV